jgi:hypothetical protein
VQPTQVDANDFSVVEKSRSSKVHEVLVAETLSRLNVVVGKVKRSMNEVEKGSDGT